MNTRMSDHSNIRATYQRSARDRIRAQAILPGCNGESPALREGAARYSARMHNTLWMLCLVSSVALAAKKPEHIVVHSIGGPTAVIEIGGLRLLTDPTFSPAGDYETVPGRFLTKTEGPAIAAKQLGHIDAVLLSHDQHRDNLDPAGRALLAQIPIVLSTPAAAQRLGSHVPALATWDHLDLLRPDGGKLRVTAVPAQHGPDGSEHLTGEVTGFILSAPDLVTVYLSGDNASLDVVRRIRERMGPIDLAFIFAGGAKTPLIKDAWLTLNSEMAAEASRILGAKRVVPLHFTEGADALENAFVHERLRERLILLQPGESAQL